MIPVTILKEAEIELWDSVAYYEMRCPRLGLDFESEIEEAITLIRHAPTRWPLKKDGTRRYLTKRFPFVIVYTYFQDHIWIIACAHCKREPGYWINRINLKT